MIAYVRQFVVPAAYSLLPPPMASESATAMLLAIGWQESRFAHRRQVNGPAHGLWQFEQGGGVRGVLGHPRSSGIARDVLTRLRYPGEPTLWGAYDAIRHNDVLACAFARLLLWTVPGPLPSRTDPDDGWRQYIAGWNPGKPKPDTWSQAWVVGWTS